MLHADICVIYIMDQVATRKFSETFATSRPSIKATAKVIYEAFVKAGIMLPTVRFVKDEVSITYYENGRYIVFAIKGMLTHVYGKSEEETFTYPSLDIRELAKTVIPQCIDFMLE